MKEKSFIIVLSCMLLSVLLMLYANLSFGLMQPKWGNSDTLPKTVERSNGYYQCRYNIQKVKKSNEFGTRIVYDYDYIELKEISDQSIQKALIENKCKEDVRSISPIILEFYKKIQIV